MTNIENLGNNLTALGEGPHWDDEKQRLLFVDIEESKVHRWDHATSKLDEPIVLEDPTVGAVVTREKGGLIAAASHRFAAIDETTGKVETLAQVTDNSDCRMNDGKCDPRGRFWAGTMGLETSPGKFVPSQGELFSLETDLTFNKHLSEIEISNGLAWSQDASRMFYIDSFKYNIRSFTYDPDSGAISDPNVVVQFNETNISLPDGQCIDTDGNLWVAMFNSGSILKIDTTAGKIVDKIKISKTALKTTSCCFGGPNLDELYVTSARNKQFDFVRGLPLGDSGSLFRVTGLGVKGLPAMSFKG